MTSEWKRNRCITFFRHITSPAVATQGYAHSGVVSHCLCSVPRPSHRRFTASISCSDASSAKSRTISPEEILVAVQLQVFFVRASAFQLHSGGFDGL